MTNLEKQLCFEVYKAANQFTKLYAKTLQPFQLTYPQYIVLLALQDQDAQKTATLCQTLDLGIGTLNPIINKLIEKNWISKKPCVNDKRASILSLTTYAKQQFPKVEEAIVKKMFHTDFFVTHGPHLKEQLQNLNVFLTMMNKEEYV